MHYAKWISTLYCSKGQKYSSFNTLTPKREGKDKKRGKFKLVTNQITECNMLLVSLLAEKVKSIELSCK